MDINTTGNGFFALIETKEEFILKFGEKLIGPLDNTEAEKKNCKINGWLKNKLL